MGIINSLMGELVGLVVAPFTGMNPWAAMAVLSLLTAFLMLFVFKLTSNQRAVRRAKDAVKAGLLELRLYADSPRVIFKAEWRIFKANLRYMAANSVPMLVMIVPIILVMAQMNLRFGSEPLRSGRETLIKMKFKAGADPVALAPKISLPPGLALTAPPVRIPSEREADWRIRADSDGTRSVKFLVGGLEVVKTITVGGPSVAAVPARAVGPALAAQVLYPGDKVLPANCPVESIEVLYRPARFSILGLRLHWLVAFFVLSMAFGLAFKGVFKVEI